MLSNRISRWLRRFADDTLYAELDAAIGPDFSGTMTFEDDVIIEGDLQVDGSITMTSGIVTIDKAYINHLYENTVGHGISVENTMKLASGKQLQDFNGIPLAAKRRKITKAVADFNVLAGSTGAVVLFSLPAKAKILDAYAYLSAKFNSSTMGIDEAFSYDGAADGTFEVADPTSLAVNQYLCVDDNDSGAAYGYIKTILPLHGAGAGTYTLTCTEDCTAGGRVVVADPLTIATGDYVMVDDANSVEKHVYCMSIADIGGGAGAAIPATQDGTAGGLIMLASTTGILANDYIKISDGDSADAYGYVVSITDMGGAGAAVYDQNFIVIDGQASGMCYVSASTGMNVNDYIEIDDGNSVPIWGKIASMVSVAAGAGSYSLSALENGTATGEIKVVNASTALVNEVVEISSLAPLSVYAAINSITVIGAEPTRNYDENFIAVDGQASGKFLIADSTDFAVNDYMEVIDAGTAKVNGYIRTLTQKGAGSTVYSQLLLVNGLASGLVRVGDSTGMSVGDFVSLTSTAPLAEFGEIVSKSVVGAGSTTYPNRAMDADGGAGGLISIIDGSVMANGEYITVSDVTHGTIYGYITALAHLERTGQATYSKDILGDGQNGYVDVLEADAATIIVDDYVEVHDDVEAADLRGYVVGKLDLGANVRIFIQDTKGGGGADVDFSAYATADNAIVRSVTRSTFILCEADLATPIDCSSMHFADTGEVNSLDATDLMIEIIYAGAKNMSTYHTADAATIESIDCWEVVLYDSMAGGAAVNLSAYGLAETAHGYSIECSEIHFHTPLGGAINLAAYLTTDTAKIDSIACNKLMIVDEASVALDISGYTMAQTAHIYSIDAYRLRIQTAMAGGADVDLSMYTTAQAAEVTPLDAFEMFMYSTSVFEQANELKAKYNAHRIDVTQHAHSDTVHGVSAADCTDLATCITLVTELLTDYAAHNADAELGAGWAYHIAQNGATHVLTSVVAPTTLALCHTRCADLKAKFDAHDADGTSHTIASLHPTTIANPAVVDLSAFTVAQTAQVKSIDAYRITMVTTSGGSTPVDCSMYTMAQSAHVFDNVTAITLSVGPTGSLTSLMGTNDVLTASAVLMAAETYKGTGLTTPGLSNIYSTTAATNIEAQMVVTGGLLNTLIAGSIDIYVEFIDENN